MTAKAAKTMDSERVDDVPWAVSIDGQQLSPKQATISVFDHGFLFGDSIYEVVRTYNGKLFAWNPHFDRLLDSARAIGLAIPWSKTMLRREMEELYASREFEGEAYIRLIITRGVGPLTLDPTNCHRPRRILLMRPLPSYPPERYSEGVKLALVKTIRNSRHATDPGIKSGNYLNNILALVEAQKAGAEEAIMLNEHGHLTECSRCNIFLVMGSKLMTPSLDCGILAGVTRAIVIQLANRYGYEVIESELGREELFDATEVFITSTTRDIVPVSHIDEHKVPTCPGTSTMGLMEFFKVERDCVHGEPKRQS